MQSETHYHQGEKISGRYFVHKTLTSSFFEVYLCLDLESNSPIVLKTFRQHYLSNPGLYKSFEAEIKTWVALEKHNNIVHCFYTDIIGNLPFIFLEWVASNKGCRTNLYSWLERGPLNIRLALDLTIDICRGLFYAGQKQRGIVHGSLNPNNILVSHDGRAKINNWGLAKIVQGAGLEISDLPISNTFKTHQYLAPEQLYGERLDVRTDIYAVGCILNELLTKRLRPSVAVVDRLSRQRFDENLPQLGSKGLFSELDSVVERCLAKTPEERFQSIDILLNKLSYLYEQFFLEMPKTSISNEEFTEDDYGNRGIAYQTLGCYPEALADYDHALALNPNYIMAYNNRGSIYTRLNRSSEALADFTRAISLDPKDAVAYYILLGQKLRSLK